MCEQPRITNPRAADDPVSYMDTVRASEHGRRYKRLALERLNLSDGLAVLDVGCGPGDDAAEFASRVAPAGRVVGIELDDRMIEEARRRSADRGRSIEFRRADVLSLPFDDEAFDRCYADRVLQLLGSGQPKAFAEITRVTKRGGLVVVCEPDVRTFTLDIGERVVTDRILAFAASRPWQGGMLPNAMKDARLRVASVDVCGHAELNFEEIDRSTPLRTLADWAVRGGAITDGEREEWLSQLDRAIEGDRFAFSSAIFVVSGEKTSSGAP